jgi:SAM-dependent methyltransferase
MNPVIEQIEIGDDTGNYFDSSYVSLVSCESRGTGVTQQINFIEQKILPEFTFPKILDFCCGHGRHVEILSQKEFDITGVDINQVFIDIGRQKIGNKAKLICCDAKEFVTNDRFDIILNLETSLNCFNTKDAVLVLGKMYEFLNTDGIMVLHVFNPEFALRKLPHRTWVKTQDGLIVFEQREFDYDKSMITITQNRLLPVGEKTYQEHTHQIRLMMFTYGVLCQMLTQVGFCIRSVYGNFKESAYTADSSDILLVCSKN